MSVSAIHTESFEDGKRVLKALKSVLGDDASPADTKWWLIRHCNSYTDGPLPDSHYAVSAIGQAAQMIIDRGEAPEATRELFDAISWANDRKLRGWWLFSSLYTYWTKLSQGAEGEVLLKYIAVSETRTCGPDDELSATVGEVVVI
jgi:hypothetical protein